MTLQQVLNADLGAVGRWLEEGFRWWVRELAEMVPPRLRRLGRRGVNCVAELQSLNGPARLWRGDALLQTAAPGQGGGLAVDLVLPPGTVLVQDLELPPLSPEDLRRLVALNIDRYTPFRAEQVYVDVVGLGRSEDGLRRRVRLGVLERERGRAALALADALELKVQGLGIAAEDGRKALQFDFMPAVRAAGGRDGAAGRLPWLWGACALLAAANVIAAIVADMADLARLERLVEAEKPVAAVAARVRRTVEGERDRRIDLLKRRAVQEPLRILDALTRALPSGAWVQRLEWNGRSVRLVGFQPPGFDLPAALHGPALANARSLASDMPAKTASGQTPFDVMADSAAQVKR